jgi:FAD/FMN-containing dehydrogenase
MFAKSPGNSSRAQFQSWGLYPRLSAEVVSLHWRTDFPLPIAPKSFVLPVGLGRSYGDCCLLDRGTLLNTRGMSRLISFDSTSGLLRCEGGVSLAEILEFAVPRGWFLPVTPGTKYVTVGGAIANDIHGKNHHLAGTFGRHVPRFELVRSDGSRMECTPSENDEWFRATVGGLGLTGLITWADIQLRPIVSRKIDYKGIKFKGLDEFLSISRASSNVEYTVAWIDCVSNGSSFARGIFMQGKHSEAAEDLGRVQPREPRLSVPVPMPSMLLNHFTVGAFNTLYYHRQLSREKTATIDYEPFFYPLDSVLNWNRIYGSEGMVQFQCVLPEETNPHGITEILRTITASGLASFLAVIKVFGNQPSPGMMSFPRPGVTLALDFPVRREVTFDLLDRLGAITLAHGGSMYPAKDARMTPRQYQAFYPQWRDFSRFIDPAFNSAFWQRVTANA